MHAWTRECRSSGVSIRMRRERNVWVIDAYVPMEDSDGDVDMGDPDPGMGFARQE